MALLDNSWDLPPLDFYHLPFESDLPQDILEVSFREQDDRDVIGDYSSSILTPPPFSGSSDEEQFSFAQLASDAVVDRMGSTGALLGSAVGTSLAANTWATPPASPPPSTGHAAAASRFTFAFSTPPFTPDASSEDDISLELLNSTTPSAMTTTPRRRKSGSGANKSRKKSTDLLAKALTVMTPTRGSPAPPSCPNSGDELDEPESKRTSHNVLERKRRNDLKRSYQALRMQLPTLVDNARAPTGHILIKAVEFIEELKTEERGRLGAIDELCQRNARAILRLQAAQRLQATQS